MIVADIAGRLSYHDGVPISANAILDHIDVPAMLVSEGQVIHANAATRALLGGHIVGENVRIALRNPAAVTLITSAKGERIRLDGLSVAGSIWEMACHVLEEDVRLILLTDLSVQTSVARAHADFVANASHELRTPLAAILGFVETLADDKAGADAAVRAKFLGTVKREAQRMQALIEDLMSLSRIEAVKHEAPGDVIDLVALAREAAGESLNANVTLDTNTPAALIAGDRGQIAQVFRNLIDNAIKYGKSDGTISIQLEVTETGWVSLNVHDDGEGIAPEHLPRLTERFYRADASRSRAAGGTGLGLSIVKHIIERHRGRFDIFSRTGEGTTASVMLPLRGRD
jgi:two-component system, OmpR family, phosphate regulon sensor histidine kinase PhoR